MAFTSIVVAQREVIFSLRLHYGEGRLWEVQGWDSMEKRVMTQWIFRAHSIRQSGASENTESLPIFITHPHS